MNFSVFRRLCLLTKIYKQIDYLIQNWFASRFPNFYAYKQSCSKTTCSFIARPSSTKGIFFLIVKLNCGKFSLACLLVAKFVVL